MKRTVFVRYEGETVYKDHIEIDPSQLTNILKFPKDVFANYEGIRISIKREDFEELINNEKVDNI